MARDQENYGVLLLQESDSLTVDDDEGSGVVIGIKMASELMGECRSVVSVILSGKANG